MYLLNEFKQAPLAEKITAITAIIVLVGLSYKFGYYTSRPLTSGWILSYFNIFDIAFASLRIIGVYLCAVLILDKDLFGEEGKKSTLVISGGLIILFIYLYFTEKISVLEILAISVPIFSGIFLIQASEFGKYICLIFLIFVSPFLNGSSDITNDLEKDRLPTVILKEPRPIEDWRLLDKVNDRMLLINFRNKDEIKIVELGDIEKIKTK